MNAVTTAEYVVLYERTIENLQAEMNQHAQQGYCVVQFSEIAENDFEGGHFTAVMVRETVSTKVTPKQLSDLQTAFGNLLTRTQNLEERIEDIEAKIDWSK